MKNVDSQNRFSGTVEYYSAYRLIYPAAVLETLQQACQLDSAKIIADMGCGTGIFTKQLLENGNPVLGVEPNAAMLQAAQQFLVDYPNFKAVLAAAEQTTLAPHSVDVITVASQLFKRYQIDDHIKIIYKTHLTQIMIKH